VVLCRVGRIVLCGIYQSFEEDPGFYWGAGAEKLGVIGQEVTAKDLERFFRGIAPDGTRLTRNVGDPNQAVGWDGTLSRPKSVTLLGELGPE